MAIFYSFSETQASHRGRKNFSCWCYSLFIFFFSLSGELLSINQIQRLKKKLTQEQLGTSEDVSIQTIFGCRTFSSNFIKSVFFSSVVVAVLHPAGKPGSRRRPAPGAELAHLLALRDPGDRPRPWRGRTGTRALPGAARIPVLQPCQPPGALRAHVVRIKFRFPNAQNPGNQCLVSPRKKNLYWDFYYASTICKKNRS